MAERQTGTVKWFRDSYGFIEAADGGRDIFVHESAIKMEGYRTLVEGERVEFDVEERPKGLQAVNVVRLDAAG